MSIKSKMRLMPMILVLLLITMMAAPMTASVVYAAQETVDLGTASTFGILAGSTITNTGPSSVGGTAGGNIGLHPGEGPALGTFPGQELMTVTGDVYLNDTVAAQAKFDLQAAYLDAEGRESDHTIDGNLVGRTLTPGVYTSASSILIEEGELILDGGGDPNAVFIFQIDSTLTTGNSEIVLINEAQACRVFWQIGSSATLGIGSNFVGHILAQESITANTGAIIQGQLLALVGAVTLDSNAITNDACVSTTGSLSVTKEVQGPVNDMVLPPFEITVTGPENYSDTQFIVAGNAYTWVDLPFGTYSVLEEALSGWSASGIGEYDVEIGEITQVTVTNTYAPPDSSNGSDDDSSNDTDDTDVELSTGELTVTKVVSGDIGEMTLSSFEITVTGPEDFSDTRSFDHEESYTWENLVPGVYTVTESRTGLSNEWTVSGEGTVQVTADQTAMTTITNAYISQVEPSNGSNDELVTPDQIDLSTTSSDDDEETLVLGIAELPRTGGNPFIMIFTGLLLSGVGLFLQRKEN